MAKHTPHIFLTEEELSNNTLNEDNTHHFVNVLRMKTSDTFISMDNKGKRFNCSISNISKKFISFEVNSSELFEEPKLKIKLVQCLLKPEAFEEVLDKATQLGIDEIIPVVADNTVFSKDLFNKKISRFQKILKSASEQSQRIFLPKLKEVASLDSMLETLDVNKTFIAYEKAEIPFKNNLREYKWNEIYFICGSEGGFTSREEELFINKKFVLVKLADNILKAETAVLSGISNIVYELS